MVIAATHAKKNTILVVDDDPQTYKLLNIVLNKKDFDVVECLTGKQAIQLCISVKPDMILLDPKMDDMTGLEIINGIREWSQTPIIILSDQENPVDIVIGLNMGADDYIFKPFNTDVLRARVNASLRKSITRDNGEPEITNGPLRMDLVRHEVYLDDVLTSFTPKEYKLLRYFITHCGKMLGHKLILNEVWGKAHSADTQYLRVFVGQIREKIEKDPSQPRIITTELGIGYRMEYLPDNTPAQPGEISS